MLLHGRSRRARRLWAAEKPVMRDCQTIVRPRVAIEQAAARSHCLRGRADGSPDPDPLPGIYPEPVARRRLEHLVELIDVACDVGAELCRGMRVDGEQLGRELRAHL